MKNCLITKLKGVVNNDNLKKLGYITIVKNSSENGQISIATDGQGAVEIKCSDGRTFSVNGTSVTSYTITSTTNTTCVFEGSGYNIEIKNKYHIKNLFASGGVYIPDITDINNSVNLYQVTISSPAYANGSINNLENIPNLGRIGFQLPGGIVGNISSLAQFRNIISLEFTANTNITGDWCELVRGIYANTGENGQIAINWIGSISNVKFNGNSIYNTGAKLIWDKDTNLITLQYNSTYESVTAPLVVQS